MISYYVDAKFANLLLEGGEKNKAARYKRHPAADSPAYP